MGRTFVRPIARVLFTWLGRAYCPNTLTVFVLDLDFGVRCVGLARVVCHALIHVWCLFPRHRLPFSLLRRVALRSYSVFVF
jgi:hypothetical protein